MEVHFKPAEINVNIDQNVTGLNKTTNATSEAPRVLSGGRASIKLPVTSPPSEVSKLAERGVFIAHYDVDSAFAPVVISGDTIISAIQASNQAQRSSLVNNSGITLTLEVQGCAFGAGLMALYAQPYALSNIWGPFNLERFDMLGVHNVFNLPHVLVDPSTTATYELHLPLISPQLRIDRAALTTVYWVVCFRHLTVPVSGTAVGFDAHATLFARYTENKQYGAIVPLSFEELKPQGVISGVVEGAGSVIEFAGTVFPSISWFTKPLAALASPVASILRVFGFSKPIRDETNLDVINRFNDSHCHSDGICDAYNLGYHTHPNAAIDDGYTGAKHDDMLISNICAKRSFIDSRDIIQAAASGTVVYRCSVTPAVRLWYSATQRGIHPAGYLARLFRYWKGTMSFRFHFIGSVFHRASVIIAYDPYPGQVNPTMQQAIAYLYHKKVALSGNVDVDFDIPHTSCLLWQSFFAVPTAAAENIVTNGDGQMGTVYVYVMNPVETNGSSDPYRLLVSATFPKMSFGLPTAGRVSSQQAVVVPLSFDEVELVHSNDLACTEVITSTKELASIMTPRSSISGVFPVGHLSIVFNGRADLQPKNSLSGANATVSIADYLSAMYLGYRGSLRATLYMHHNAPANVGNPMSSTCFVRYDPNFPVGQETLNSNTNRFVSLMGQSPYMLTKASGMNDTALVPSVDINIPHHYPEAYQQVSPNPFSKYAYDARWSVPLGTVADQSAVVVPFAGVGDDFTWGMFIGTPVERNNA